MTPQYSERLGGGAPLGMRWKNAGKNEPTPVLNRGVVIAALIIAAGFVGFFVYLRWGFYG